MDDNLIISIGSLPFDDIELAVEYALAFDIPAVPELPSHDGIMYDYLAHPGKLAAAGRFKKGLRERGIKTAKIQSPGPLTGTYKFNSQEAVHRARAHLEALADGLSVETLYVFLDEPALGRNKPAVDYLSLWETIFSTIRLPPQARVIYGIHSCNDLSPQWGDIFSAPINIISFNATRYDLINHQNDSRFLKAYETYRGHDGKICWGVIDVRPGNGIAKLEELIQYQKGDLISASCGLGGLPLNDLLTYDKIIQYLREIKRSLIGKVINSYPRE